MEPTSGGYVLFQQRVTGMLLLASNDYGVKQSNNLSTNCTVRAQNRHPLLIIGLLRITKADCLISRKESSNLSEIYYKLSSTVFGHSRAHITTRNALLSSTRLLKYAAKGLCMRTERRPLIIAATAIHVCSCSYVAYWTARIVPQHCLLTPSHRTAILAVHLLGKEQWCAGRSPNTYLERQLQAADYPERLTFPHSLPAFPSPPVLDLVAYSAFSMCLCCQNRGQHG